MYVLLINFSDIFGVFANPAAHRALIDLIINKLNRLDSKIDAVVGLDARGFVFGPQIALELQIPFLPVRKHGKLPGKVIQLEYDLEYGNKNSLHSFEINVFLFSGKDSTEMQIDILKPGTKILLVDDLLATGGQF